MQNTLGQTFAKERTESDILAQAPIPIRLGGKDYSVKPLPILKNAAWRKNMVKVLNENGADLNTQMGSMTDFTRGLMVAFFTFPEKVLALVRDYAPYLPWDDILKEPEGEELGVTDEELVLAFSRIMVVAYPFSNLLGMMTLAAAQA